MVEPVATSAKGYTHGANPGWWWAELDGEDTPELIWPRSTAIYERMCRTDAQVMSVLEAVTLPLRRAGWRLDRNGAEDKVVQLIAEDLGLPVVGEPDFVRRRTSGRFSWKRHLYEALLMLPFGHSFFEPVFRIDDAGLARLRKLELRPSSTIAKVNVARDGGLISIEQTPSGTDTEGPVIEVDYLVAYVNQRAGGNWLGKSLLRPAYKDWLIKDRLLRIQAQTVHRNGMGIPTYTTSKVPEGIITGPEVTAWVDAELKAGRTIAENLQAGENSGASIPNGATLSLEGVKGNLPDADGPIRYHDEQIARAVLAHFLNLGGDKSTGSYALGDTFQNFFILALQTIAEDIADVANQHIVEDLVDLNFGEHVVAPRLVFDEIGSRHPATAQAIQMLMNAGALSADPNLEQHLRTQYGLPDRDPAVAPAAPPQAAALQALAAAIAPYLPTVDERSTS